MIRRRRNHPARSERGSTIPLVIGFTAVLALAAGVVVDVSAAWLQRQSLNNLADGAALAAADQAAEGTEVYGDGLDPTLRLDEAVARSAAADYLAAAGRQFEGLSFSIAFDGDRVRVVVRAPLDMPLSIPGGPEAPLVAGHGSALVAVDN